MFMIANISGYLSDVILLPFISVSGASRDFSPSTIAVGPSADASSFNQLDFPLFCTNITQPFGFPETRNISCNT